MSSSFQGLAPGANLLTQYPYMPSSGVLPGLAYGGYPGGMFGVGCPGVGSPCNGMSYGPGMYGYPDMYNAGMYAGYPGLTPQLAGPLPSYGTAVVMPITGAAMCGAPSIAPGGLYNKLGLDYGLDDGDEVTMRYDKDRFGEVYSSKRGFWPHHYGGLRHGYGGALGRGPSAGGWFGGPRYGRGGHSRYDDDLDFFHRGQYWGGPTYAGIGGNGGMRGYGDVPGYMDDRRFGGRYGGRLGGRYDRRDGYDRRGWYDDDRYDRRDGCDSIC